MEAFVIGRTPRIKVMKMEYWDGQKFMARLDKPDAQQVMERIRVVMKAKFMSLPALEQRALAKDWTRGSGHMVVRRTVRMTEEEYNRSEKIKD